MTEGAHALLAGRIPRRVNEELATAFLGRRASLGQRRRAAAFRERPAAPCSRRTGCPFAGIQQSRRAHRGVGATAGCAWRSIAPDAWSCRSALRMPYINAGSSAGVFTVLGTPRARTTDVAAGSSRRTTPSGSSRSIRIVACCGYPGGTADEVVEPIVNEERIQRILRQALPRLLQKSIVPSSPGWQVRQVWLFPPKVS